MKEIEKAAQIIRSSNYAVALTGAGISTPSGIPDFRSPGSGLWEKVNPMLVASIFAFRLRPKRFFDWFRPLGRTLLEAEPNPAHIALARLEEAGFLKAVITQNIDNLHQKAGSKRVLELHGHLREAQCMKCRRIVPTEGLWEKYLNSDEVPRCECGGILKPRVVLFGESLPKGVFLEALGEVQRCDVMLIAGSSLEVYPAAELPTLAYQKGARLIVVNLQSTYADAVADVVIHDDVAKVLPAIADMCLKSTPHT
ncbi:MAG: hypothetical protein DRI61_11085 [Chloroflexi bacterium]|nr:MAG: hypothetical protein DRI61_11085 [Chloroflexota bacterium]HDN79713.1 NAD-dependent deacylase [Chloroflexota bacterium]